MGRKEQFPHLSIEPSHPCLKHQQHDQQSRPHKIRPRCEPHGPGPKRKDAHRMCPDVYHQSREGWHPSRNRLVKIPQPFHRIEVSWSALWLVSLKLPTTTQVHQGMGRTIPKGLVTKTIRRTHRTAEETVTCTLTSSNSPKIVQTRMETITWCGVQSSAIHYPWWPQLGKTTCGA